MNFLEYCVGDDIEVKEFGNTVTGHKYGVMLTGDLDLIQKNN